MEYEWANILITIPRSMDAIIAGNINYEYCVMGL